MDRDVLARVLKALETRGVFQDLQRECVGFGDLTVSVVSPRTLYDVKKDTVRTKDRIDAELLRTRFALAP